VENAWDSPARTCAHFSVRETLVNEAISVWKGDRNGYGRAL
jgi:hypothetical protein